MSILQQILLNGFFFLPVLISVILSYLNQIYPLQDAFSKVYVQFLRGSNLNESPSYIYTVLSPLDYLNIKKKLIFSLFFFNKVSCNTFSTSTLKLLHRFFWKPETRVSLISLQSFLSCKKHNNGKMPIFFYYIWTFKNLFVLSKKSVCIEIYIDSPTCSHANFIQS